MQSIKSKDGVTETCLLLLGNARRYLKALLHDKLPGTVLAAAWDEFYRLYDDLIRRFVISLGVPRSDVDDCVQEVWMEVAARLVEFDRPVDRPGLRAWLYTLVRSKATNVFRKRARLPFESLDARTGIGLEPHDPRSGPTELYERQWKEAVLAGTVARLCEELCATNSHILQMRLIDRRSVKHVASKLDLTPEQVYARQHRILKKLRARIAAYTGSPLSAEVSNRSACDSPRTCDTILAAAS